MRNYYRHVPGCIVCMCVYVQKNKLILAQHILGFPAQLYSYESAQH